MEDIGIIIVIGSSNTDMVIGTDHFPLPGEMVLGGKFLMNAGGKGANQAVAAARLGGKVSFIGKVGHDVFLVSRQFRIFKMKAYKVNAIYLPDFIVIKKGYLAFVDYWNNKLKTYNKYLIRTGKK